MPNECFVCGENALYVIGGIMLCQTHRTAVMAEIDSLRAAGKKVDAARIAYDMRDPETPARYAPSAEAVHKFLQDHDITGSQAAKMMYLSGSRQVRKYTGGQKPRQMDGARWFCLHAHTILNPDDIAKIEQAMVSNLNS